MLRNILLKLSRVNSCSCVVIRLETTVQRSSCSGHLVDLPGELSNICLIFGTQEGYLAKPIFSCDSSDNLIDISTVSVSLLLHVFSVIQYVYSMILSFDKIVEAQS